MSSAAPDGPEPPLAPAVSLRYGPCRGHIPPVGPPCPLCTPLRSTGNDATAPAKANLRMSGTGWHRRHTLWPSARPAPTS
jgi:hypothetical protein